jgi:hypothetical protein
MASAGAVAGIIILIIGLIVGVYAVIYPVHQSVLSQTLSIDGNDYQSANFNLTSGERAYIQVSISNNTIFTFDIMNRTQYYNFYTVCAPYCHTGLNIVGCSCNVTSNPLTAVESKPTLENMTVTSSSPITIDFTAPSSGTYYFVFDNTIGPNYSCYISTCLGSLVSPQATYATVGSFSLSGYAINWNFLGVGIVLLIIGGLIATVFWRSGRRTLPPSSSSP